jgi:hypothetical protein
MLISSGRATCKAFSIAMMYNAGDGLESAVRFLEEAALWLRERGSTQIGSGGLLSKPFRHAAGTPWHDQGACCEDSDMCQ